MALKRTNLRGTPSGSTRLNDVLDCTAECKMEKHSLLVLSCTCLGNLKLLKHCATVCGNPFRIQDAMGRNTLHVAASKGHMQLLYWLAAKRKVKIDVQDLESKWTALHRSSYYGQLGAAVLLLKYGADINSLDNDKWSPLTIINADRETFKYFQTMEASNVYTWGRNPNVTLGHDRTRKCPEKLEFSLSPTANIIKVVLSKFHSVFLSNGGHVLTCGHGPGGRLGHDSEQSIVIPRLVKAMSEEFCVGIAAARNHTVILTRSGSVYTCGLNDAHQLGHGSIPVNAPSNYVAPKLVRALKSKHVTAVGTGRYHTAMCTDTELFTVGKNLGQLGYEKTYETQVTPHAVAGINLDSDVITHMSVSDSATAVLTKKHHVFVCTNFIVKHIRFGFLAKMSCIQFEVCASLSDRDYLRTVETEPTKLLILDSEHKLWLWEPTKRGSIPSVLPGFAKHNVMHFSLGKSLTIVTKKGELYKGNGSVNKPLNLHRVPHIQNAHAVFTDFKANNYAYIQTVYRNQFLPAVSPGTLTSDLAALLEEACLPGSLCDMKIEVGGQSFAAHKFIFSSQTQDFSSQLLTSDIITPFLNEQSISSFKLRSKCDNPAVFDVFLRYIYGSHIRLIPPPKSNLILTTSSADSFITNGNEVDDAENTPDTSFTSIDENDLTEEYDRYSSNNLQTDYDIESIQAPFFIRQSTPRRKKSHSFTDVADHSINLWGELESVLQISDYRADMKSLLLLATSFDLGHLKKALKDIMSQVYKPQTILRPQLKFKRQQHDEYSDLTLISKEGKAIHCHRCVLVARSEYFRSMLLMGWKESSDDITSLSMPNKYRVLKAVIDFIYTDEFPATVKGAGNDLIEWVMAVLVMADQLLLIRLKELCEYALAKNLNLRNAVEFLEFAETYSAFQLKKSCLEFICVNASFFLEERYLENVALPLLEELSKAYQGLVVSKSKRTFKLPDPDPEFIPESYFLDDKVEECTVESEESGNEGESLNGGNEVLDSASHGGGVHEVVSPRATSNSRRKRKRKTSQSETKKRLASTPPPTSPNENELSSTSRVSPSPPNPASPVNVISPSSPVGASAPVCSPKLSANISSDSYDCSTNSPTPVTKSTPPWNSTENKHMSFDGCDSGRKKPNADEYVKAKSAPAQNSIGGKGRYMSLTPQSGPARDTGRHTKMKKNTPMRLINKFNIVSQDSDLLDSKKTAYIRQNSSPAAVEGAVKGPWTCISNGALSGGKSLRDIMAKEKEIELQQRTEQRKQVPPPLNRSISNDSGKENKSGFCASSAKSQPIPVRKNQQRENHVTSPSNSSSSPSPWKTSDSSPTISMRDLMAEAEAEAKNNRRRASINKDKSIMKILEEKPVKRQLVPLQCPYQQVSFASIIKSQESERNRSRSLAKKPLSLIQIEERAISELEKAYSAVENPDEFIVIERVSHRQPQRGYKRHGGMQGSPWNGEVHSSHKTSV